MLTRWDPFREMMTLRNAMDRLLEEAFVLPSRLRPLGEGLGVVLDVAETEEEFLVRASLPGINPDDLDISLAENVLTIKGEVKADEDIKEEQYHIRERRYGSFARSVSLPAPVDADAVEATYENGILTLRLPKAAEARPRKIPVRATKMIEGKKK